MRMGGAISQLDLPSLTPLFVAGCWRLQLGVPHLATSVYYCKLFIIDPTFCGSRFYTGRLLAIKTFLYCYRRSMSKFSLLNTASSKICISDNSVQKFKVGIRS